LPRSSRILEYWVFEHITPRLQHSSTPVPEHASLRLFAVRSYKNLTSLSVRLLSQ
jgi:hypothetical protein